MSGSTRRVGQLRVEYCTSPTDFPILQGRKSERTTLARRNVESPSTERRSPWTEVMLRHVGELGTRGSSSARKRRSKFRKSGQSASACRFRADCATFPSSIWVRQQAARLRSGQAACSRRVPRRPVGGAGDSASAKDPASCPV